MLEGGVSIKEFNILFTSGGRRVSLVKHFKNTLNSLGLKNTIVVTDSTRTASASFVADFSELVPSVISDNYISSLLDLCKHYSIKLLIPLIDSELYLLSCNITEFERVGTTVLVSAPDVILCCEDKRNTFDFFKAEGFKTPELLDIDTVLAEGRDVYPVLLKPAVGSASVGVTRINNPKELEFFRNYVSEPILQDYQVGQEYTVDVLVDFKGKVCSVIPRLRIEARAGEVSKGMTVKNTDIINASRQVVQALKGALGCITLQCFLTGRGELIFIEINPRFGGGIPLSIVAGADFPRWIIEMMTGKEAGFPYEEWKDGVVMLRYDEAVFVTSSDILGASR